MNESQAKYFEFQVHRSLQGYYYLGYSGGFVLGFVPEFKEKYLPASLDYDNQFEITLFDQIDGKTYRSPIVASYEHHLDSMLLDPGGDPVLTLSVQSYFYSLHHCQCHRKQDAEAAGAIVENDECEGDRFLVQSIIYPELPHLILYSEMTDQDSLDATLTGVVPDDRDR